MVKEKEYQPVHSEYCHLVSFCQTNDCDYFKLNKKHSTPI